VSAPGLVQLSSDTCVLAAQTGAIPVYDGGYILPPPGEAALGFVYVCAAKAWPLDLESIMNSDVWSDTCCAPVGPRLLAGIPFLFSQGNPNRHVWKASVAARSSSKPVTLIIPVNRPAVSRAWFLLNTEWGQPGPHSYLSLEFTGDRGAHFVKELVGGVDVRDYHRGVYTNTINGTTTRPAYRTSDVEMIDRVEVDLPPEFLTETLRTITLHDTGGSSFQRAILRAVTVSSR
jgi:hypothetical protein